MSARPEPDRKNRDLIRPAPREPKLAEPFLQVVRGEAGPEEIAALVATLMAIAAARSTAAAQAKPAPVLSQWNAPARRLRAPLHPAPGAWRRSALP
jgi:Acyl-CoA carboxylase epsilon subunit